MSTTKTDAVSAAQHAERTVDTKPVLIGVFAITLFAAFLRLYEQLFGWNAGLDSVTPEFQVYWTNLLNTSVVVSIFKPSVRDHRARRVLLCEDAPAVFRQRPFSRFPRSRRGRLRDDP
jgi:Ammonia monooxygenase/methane monooxygenase, subunit C